MVQTGRVLILTGGPAVGKTSSARGLAARRARCAVVDVDDVRQLVRSGGVAPWLGLEGAAQADLGARNASALATNFAEAGIDVVITDVVTPATAAVYRTLLPAAVIVRLVATKDVVRRRAASRPVYLTDAEVDLLHHADDVNPPQADHVLDTSELSSVEQMDLVAGWWP